MSAMVYAVIAEGVLCGVSLVLLIIQWRKMNAYAADVMEMKKSQEEFESRQKSAFESFCLTLKSQMFIHEANLLSEHGEWCLEHEGVKKYFSPGKIEKVLSPQKEEESSFQYVNDEVICTVTCKGQVKSELTFTKNGAPKRGKIFEDGKLIREFTYDELGQVVEGR